MQDPTLKKLRERQDDAYWRRARRKWPEVSARDKAIFDRLMAWVAAGDWMTKSEKLVAERAFRYALAHKRED